MRGGRRMRDQRLGSPEADSEFHHLQRVQHAEGFGLAAAYRKRKRGARAQALPCEYFRARVAALEMPEIVHARDLRMLRQVALSYNFNKELYSKLKLNGLSLTVAGRDLFYIYNSLPYNFNLASNNSNNTAFSGENGFLPMTRNIMFSLRASF